MNLIEFEKILSIHSHPQNLTHTYKKGGSSQSPFLWFPIGTISKVKKIVLGLRYKVRSFRQHDQLFFYVMKHSFRIP